MFSLKEELITGGHRDPGRLGNHFTGSWPDTPGISCNYTLDTLNLSEKTNDKTRRFLPETL